MESLFLQVLNMSITASYAILAVLIIRLLLKRMPKTYAYALWAAVLFRLVCPVSFPAVFSILNAPPLDLTVAQSSGAAGTLSYVPSDIGYMGAPRVTTGIPTLNMALSDALPASEPYASVNPMQVWIASGAVVWAIGSVVLLIYGLLSYIFLQRRLVTAVRADKQIYESDDIRSPLVLGFIKPRIYIPFGLDERERQYILQHEAQHLRRKDHWIKPVAFIVLAIHWFNPLVWLAYMLMSRDMEMSCDEKVLLGLGSEHKQGYSSTLLSFAANRRFPSAGPLAFGEAGVRERIVNILRFKAPTKARTAWLAVFSVAVIAACTANPPSIALPEEEGEIYGRYAFDKRIYMNPISSFFVHDGFRQYYTFTEQLLIVSDETGSRQIYPVSYNRSTVDKDEFERAFFPEGFGVPDLDKYKEIYQYRLTAPPGDPDLDAYEQIAPYTLTVSSDVPDYRLYVLDDEIWLVEWKAGSAAIGRNAYIWSIFRIKKTGSAVSTEYSLTGSKEDVDEFLALQNDKDAPSDPGVVYNVTPANVQQNSEYQIFKYADSAASYLLYDNEIFPLGIWGGGSGVTSMALADQNGDGMPELYFTYSFGSGLHRSHVAYFDPATNQTEAFDYMNMNGDMFLAVQSDGSLSLIAATVKHIRDFAHLEMIGTETVANIVKDGVKPVLRPVEG